MKRTSKPVASRTTTSRTDSVVVVEYCGYSGSTTTRRMPSARSACRRLATDGSP